jgi:hypothetical protein
VLDWTGLLDEQRQLPPLVLYGGQPSSPTPSSTLPPCLLQRLAAVSQPDQHRRHVVHARYGRIRVLLGGWGAIWALLRALRAVLSQLGTLGGGRGKWWFQIVQPLRLGWRCSGY